jgi:hypothetical protein
MARTTWSETHLDSMATGQDPQAAYPYAIITGLTSLLFPPPFFSISNEYTRGWKTYVTPCTSGFGWLSLFWLRDTSLLVSHVILSGIKKKPLAQGFGYNGYNVYVFLSFHQCSNEKRPTKDQGLRGRGGF